MNASNQSKKLMVVAILGALASATLAQGIGAGNNTKINNAKAKAYTDGSIKNQEFQKDVVHFGSKKDGTCNLNIGTAKAGEKAPKNQVVTTKNVINICK